jgi:hypothetical protein
VVGVFLGGMLRMLCLFRFWILLFVFCFVFVIVDANVIYKSRCRRKKSNHFRNRIFSGYINQDSDSWKKVRADLGANLDFADQAI